MWPELLNWTTLHSSEAREEVLEDREADLKVCRVMEDVWVIRCDPELRLNSVYNQHKFQGQWDNFV